jgi:hypothetical protein
MKKLYIIRKYVKANSAKDAMLKENKHPVDDVWLDDDWKKENINKIKEIKGFK